MRFLALLVVLLPVCARATPSADAAFRSWASSAAKAAGGGIASWGTVRHGGDAALEHYAVVCLDDQDKEQGTLVFLDDGSGHHWSFSTTRDGRNDCTPQPGPKWTRRKSLRFETLMHKSSDAIEVALRGGHPVVVRTDSMVEGYYQADDFDALERTTREPGGAARHGALFIVDGKSGAYRAPKEGRGLDVSIASTRGERVAVRIGLSPAVVPGEQVEVSTIAANDAPMAWMCRWDGKAWSITGTGHAPKERPTVEGSATQLSVPIVRRQMMDRDDATPLCVARGTKQTRVSTCDHPPLGIDTVGAVYVERYRPPENLSDEP